MRVDAVELRHVRVPLKRAFKHALHERTASDCVVVSLSDGNGHAGWGEIVPRSYVTGETIESVLERVGPAFGERILGARIDDVQALRAWLDEAREFAGRDLATLSGFDLALTDLWGQAHGAKAADLLGPYVHDELPAGVIIGFEMPTDKVARYCAALRLGGKRHVKVKVGLPDDDVRLAAVAKVWRGLPLRLDANAAWTAAEAIERLRTLGAVAPIASIEQPVPADDLDGLRAIREQTSIAVMADESVCTLQDARRLVEARAADILNVRLGKNGGSWASHRLVEFARAHGLGVHLGTMVGESGILSRASEIFGRCVPGFECLDGKGQNAFLLEVDIVRQASDHSIDWNAPGLGIEVDPDRVRAHQVGPTQGFASP